MRSMLCIFSFLLTISISNCSYSIHINEQDSTRNIIGKWIVEEVNFKGTDEDFLQTSTIDFYTFFGANLWSMSKDKFFFFHESGLLDTDMITSELKNKVKLSYKFNKNIEIKANLISDTLYEFIVVIDKLDTDSMVWKFGDFMDVKLVRNR